MILGNFKKAFRKFQESIFPPKYYFCNMALFRFRSSRAKTHEHSKKKKLCAAKIPITN